MLSKSSNSIVHNIPKPKCINYNCAVNVLNDEPVRFVLLIGPPIVTLRPDFIEKGMSKMLKNMIEHGEVLKKELR